MGENVEPDQQAGQTSGAGYVVAASLPDRATVARLVEIDSTGFRIAGPARVHTYRAGSLMLTDHGPVTGTAAAVLEQLTGATPDARAQWRDGIGDGAVVGRSSLPDTTEGFVVADGRLWSVALTGVVGSVPADVVVERLLRAVTGH
ncbi:hypothetical protein GA0111570_10346 [Raineyella antarctica]|uniref:Uncharacterized protein n=1 Tax=Raineyella antarctica TaxID=1577474 RepID=A0A1G6GFQ0_9ACTN|nr:hypothetical protein [Raineyella antarctica]SDB80729.1 hypothetical protein GA0111570_10346 [Raineyella antarctica]